MPSLRERDRIAEAGAGGADHVLVSAVPGDDMTRNERFIQQDWCDSRVHFRDESDRLYSQYPEPGLVVGTFAAVPYVHLQLEARRRLYPHVPILVHDDASPFVAQLRRLCIDYGADFETNSERIGHELGDLSVFVGGLKWAERRRLDLLVKVSRRWLFLANWTTGLQTLAWESQYATFSNYTIPHGLTAETRSLNVLAFRTECLALAVKMWAMPRFYRSAINHMNRNQDIRMEDYIHGFAKEFERVNCTQADDWKAARKGLPDDRQGYAQWPIMGTDWVTAAPSAAYLWQKSHGPGAYAAQAERWGLPYSEADFGDPNQGCCD